MNYFRKLRQFFSDNLFKNSSSNTFKSLKQEDIEHKTVIDNKVQGILETDDDTPSKETNDIISKSIVIKHEATNLNTAIESEKNYPIEEESFLTISNESEDAIALTSNLEPRLLEESNINIQISNNNYKYIADIATSLLLIIKKREAISTIADGIQSITSTRSNMITENTNRTFEQQDIRLVATIASYSTSNDFNKQVNLEINDSESVTSHTQESQQEEDPLGFLDEEFESDLDQIINSEDFIERASILTEIPNFKDNKAYISEYQTNDEMSENALEMLVYANKRLVFKIVKRYKLYQSAAFTEDDMLQHGMIGLIKAAKRFDLNKGFEFSTYAIHWIKQEITRGIFNNSNTVRIPVHMGELVNKVKRMERKSNIIFGEIDYEWIANELELPLEKIINAVRVRNSFMTNVSLDVPVGTDENSTLGDFVEDTKFMDPSTQVINNSLSETIIFLLNTLTTREKDILIKRFGLDGKPPRTLETIGKDYNVTRERIRQIESKALRKLQKKYSKEKLRDYYEV